MFRRFIVVTGFLASALPSVGQIQLTDRLSNGAISYVYGKGGTVFSGTPNTTDNTLELAGVLNFPFFGSAPSPIDASVTCVNQHNFMVTGSLTDIESIAVNALSTSTGHATNGGLAAISTNNNQLTLGFTVPNLTAYRLNGNVSFLPHVSRYVRLQKFNGLSWIDTFSSFSLSATGPFSNTGTMAAGSWRVITGINSNATTNSTTPDITVSHNFDFLLDIGTRCSGTATLEGFVGTLPVSGTVVIKQGTASETRSTSIDPVTGEFLFSTNFIGPVDVYLKGRTFLRKVQSGVNAGLNCCTFSLNNGDCDGNNIVDIGDYSLLAARFSQVVGDALYDVRADLNGDGIIDIADYTLLARNFSAVGTELP